MVTTDKEAVDDFNKMLKDAWEADPSTTAIPILWGNVAVDPPGDTDVNGDPLPYLATEYLHEFEKKVSLKGLTGSRYEVEGTLMAAIHTGEGDGPSAGLPLIAVLMSTFRGKRSPLGVTFHNVEKVTVGKQGVYYVIMMTATFRYDLIG
jgi:hypothetical protein